MGRKARSARLTVLMNNRCIGTLEQNASGGLLFKYAESWLQSGNSMDISRSLPRRVEPYRGALVYSFFENLLPDNIEIRKIIASKVGAQSTDPFDLLAVLGRDCVGALQMVEDDAQLQAEKDAIAGTPLRDDEIEKLLKNLKRAPLGIETERDLRISVAGAQEKTALLYHKKRWHEPHGSTPTTHIFKPPMGMLYNGIDMTESVDNEWLCLTVCKKLGLPVASVAIEEFGSIRCLVVQRFDREWSADGKRIYRIPQEDLCQALGVSGTRKYESDGGPGIVAIMDLLNISNSRQIDRQHFFKAQIIFQLLGASDGHAKNFSIFLGPNGFQLTPWYDVLTAYPALKKRQIEKKQLKLAMAVGISRKYQMKTILLRHWRESAHACSMPVNECEQLFEEIRTGVQKLSIGRSELPERFSPLVLESTLDGIQSMSRQLFG